MTTTTLEATETEETLEQEIVEAKTEVNKRRPKVILWGILTAVFIIFGGLMTSGQFSGNAMSSMISGMFGQFIGVIGFGVWVVFNIQLIRWFASFINLQKLTKEALKAYAKIKR